MKFPDWEDLTPQQKLFCSLDLDEIDQKNCVVTGPAGTGKTVVALHRAEYLLKTDPEMAVLVLMHNSTLERYVSSHIRRFSRDYVNESMKPRITVKKWNTWLQWWLSDGNRWNQSKRDFEFDFEFLFRFQEVSNWDFKYPWEKIRDRLGEYLDESGGVLPDARRVPYLVVDEGQDLPSGLYDFFSDLVDDGHCPGITVTADDRQVLTDDNSEIDDITAALGCNRRPDRESHHVLDKNFRNPFTVASAAKHFVEDKESLPSLPGPKPTDEPVHVRRMADKNSCIERLIRWVINHPTKNVGVFFRKREAVEMALQKFPQDLIEFSQSGEESARSSEALDPRRFQGYWSSEDDKLNKKLAGNLDFDKPGRVTILCDSSVKGLEFDAVFIMGAEKRDRNGDRYMETQYVMASRSREILEYLILSDGSDASRRGEAGLPQHDGEIVIWKDETS